MSQTLNAHATTNGKIPENSRIYTLSLNLTAGTSQTIDLRPYKYKNVIKEVQGVWIDNSANSTGFSLSVSGGQNIQVPPNYQAIAPLYLTQDNVLTVTGNGNVTIVLLNFPTPACFWSAIGSSIPISGGSVVVSDPLLEALISNGSLTVSNALYGPADVLTHPRIGKAYSGNLTASGNTTIITGASSCFVTDLDVWLSPDATLAAAGILTVTGQFFNNGTVFSRKVYVPAAAAANGAPTPIFRLTDVNLLGLLSGDSFEIGLSAALTAGAVEYTIIGGTTNQT